LSSDSDSSEEEFQPDSTEINDHEDESSQEDPLLIRGRKRPRKQSLTPRPEKINFNEPINAHKTKSKLRSGRDFFVCHLCDIKFDTKEGKFLHHETIHLEGAHDMNEGGTTRLYSTICGKSSLIPGQITAHNETFHSHHFKFICLLCKRKPRQFTSERLLAAHQVIHATPTPTNSFQCILCTDLTFPSTIDLDNHLKRVHFHSLTSLSNAYIVNRIGRECFNPSIPDDELRLLGKRKHDPCRFCGYRPSRSGLFALRAHERKEHPEKFVHLCNHPNCGESYAEVNELRTCEETHKTSVNQGQFKCFVCNGK